MSFSLQLNAEHERQRCPSPAAVCCGDMSDDLYCIVLLPPLYCQQSGLNRENHPCCIPHRSGVRIHYIWPPFA